MSDWLGIWAARIQRESEDYAPDFLVRAFATAMANGALGLGFLMWFIGKGPHGNLVFSMTALFGGGLAFTNLYLLSSARPFGKICHLTVLSGFFVVINASLSSFQSGDHSPLFLAAPFILGVFALLSLPHALSWSTLTLTMVTGVSVASRWYSGVGDVKNLTLLLPPSLVLLFITIMGTVGFGIFFKICLGCFWAATKNQEDEIEEVSTSNRTMATVSSLKSLAAGVAEEINNPLTISMGYLEILSEQLSAQQAALIVPIERSLERISRLVFAFNIFSDHGHEASVSHLEQIIETAVEICHINITAKGIVLTHDYPPAMPVKGIDKELALIVVSLLNNAIDAASQSDEKDIVIKVSDDGAYFALEVMDHGPGIDPEQLEGIFSPVVTTKNNHGLGIGLWVVYHVVTKLGGMVNFARHDGQTIVTVRLPKANLDGARVPA